LGGFAAEGTDESQVAQLMDGTVMMNPRFAGEELYRALGFSKDGGMTWEENVLDENLQDPHCQGSLLMTPQGLLFSNLDSQDDFFRQNVTVRLSLDEGETWAYSKPIDEGPSAYSALSYLPDGKIGLLWESGGFLPYDRIRFATFNVEWLKEESLP
jgi:Neuraminidase (sialidase)